MSDLEDVVAAVADRHYTDFYPTGRGRDLFGCEMLGVLRRQGLLASAYDAANAFQVPPDDGQRSGFNKPFGTLCAISICKSRDRIRCK